MRFGAKLLLSTAACMLLLITSGMTTASADDDCDECEDESVAIWRCFSGRHHQMIQGGDEDKWMSMHGGDEWYCSDCDADPDCPGMGGGGEIHIPDGESFSAVIMRGDPEALKAAVSERSRYLLASEELGMLAVTDCKGTPIAQYKLTPSQIGAFTELSTANSEEL